MAWNDAGSAPSTGSCAAAGDAHTSTQPTSSGSLRRTSPPAARVSSCAPRHSPITGTPVSSASRMRSISCEIHGWMSVSCVLAVPPAATTASYPPSDSGSSARVASTVSTANPRS